jgi:hypothetical protein
VFCGLRGFVEFFCPLLITQDFSRVLIILICIRTKMESYPYRIRQCLSVDTSSTVVLLLLLHIPLVRQSLEIQINAPSKSKSNTNTKECQPLAKISLTPANDRRTSPLALQHASPWQPARTAIARWCRRRRAVPGVTSLTWHFALRLLYFCSTQPSNQIPCQLRGRSQSQLSSCGSCDSCTLGAILY